MQLVKTAVVQGVGIKSIFLLDIDFTYLDRRDGELVFKEMAAVDFNCSRFTSYVLGDRTLGSKCLCLTRELIKLSITVATRMTAIYSIQC